jgi:hypothetical protein
MKRCSATGKKKFRSEIKAAYALGKIRSNARNDPDNPIPIRHYHCKFCGFHHLTSQEKNEDA